jgi:hypothetical protein
MAGKYYFQKLEDSEFLFFMGHTKKSFFKKVFIGDRIEPRLVVTRGNLTRVILLLISPNH